MPDMTSLSVGDRLVYPNQGLCTVTEIKTEEIAGQKLTFVSMVIIETGAKVKVPREKLEKNGVRRVSTAEDVKKVVDYLKSDSEKASLDWKKRARENTARLSEGGLLGLAEVVKGLQVLSELRPLPPKERELYNDARHLFVDELSAAMNVPPADAEDAFDILLFVPGKDRPKRTQEEFASLVGGEEGDELGLEGDLIGIDGGEEPAEEAPEADAEKSEDGEAAEEGDEDAPKKKPAKVAAPPAPPKAAKGKKTLISDVEVTMPATAALTEGLPKKRGRPPKPKPVMTEPPPPPKKRGRPPKPRPAVTEPPPPPKKRGRPPKAK